MLARPDKNQLRATLLIFAMLVTVGALAPTAQSQDADEQAVRRVIESFGIAINGGDLPTLLGHIAEDAVIDSRIARGKVSKQKYADAMTRAFERHQITGFEIRHVKVTMVDATHATVLGTIVPRLEGRRLTYDHEWKLEKRAGLWLIVETDYRTKPQERMQPVQLAWRASRAR